MSIGDRLWDDSAFDAAPDDGPHYVQILLVQLGVSDARRGRQTAAIRRWLLTNVPSDTLRRSIRDAGLASVFSVARRKSKLVVGVGKSGALSRKYSHAHHSRVSSKRKLAEAQARKRAMEGMAAKARKSSKLT